MYRMDVSPAYSFYSFEQETHPQWYVTYVYWVVLIVSLIKFNKMAYTITITLKDAVLMAKKAKRRHIAHSKYGYGITLKLACWES